MSTPQALFSLRSFDFDAMSTLQTVKETDGSTERPVVSAFLIVELGSSKATTKMACVDL